MLRKISILFLSFLLSVPVFSNNLDMGSTVNVSMVSLTESEATLSVSVRWENSWRDSYNNDAVWVFFKYRTTTKSQWSHALLKDGGTVSNGYTSLAGSSSTGVVGVFVYRADISSGESSTELTVKWNYSGSGITRQMFEQQEVFLMAQGIEMVYVPFGPFTVGDGVSNNSLRDASGNPFTVGASLSKVYDNSSGAGYTIRSAFPTGYSGFYVMKYEVSQEQYMAFLNTLSLSEQKALLGNRVVSLGKGDYIFGSVSSVSKRNGIVVSRPSNGTDAIVFDNNYTKDDKFGEPDDGRTLACNYMSVYDLLGYSSWAGLRPMTEMEYEKSCRRLSPMSVVPGDYAWGSTDIELLLGIAEGSGGTASERPNGGYVNAEGSGGPVRCGAFSFISSDRVSAGAGFSGVMEMSGNVKELCAHVSMGVMPLNKHGEGIFSTGFWQVPARGYYGVRGGGFSSRREQLRVSDRQEMSGDYITSPGLRDSTVGFRSVRMLSASDFRVNPGQIRLSGFPGVGTPVVCSGVPFSIESISLASVFQLSGVTFRYEWYKNGQLLPDARGASLSYPSGIFNIEASDQSFTFTRKAISYVGEAETDEITVVVPGRLKILGGSVYTLECGSCRPAGATVKLTGSGLFCWKNGTDHTVVKGWTSSGSLTDQYSPNHQDFGYAPSEKALWCISNQSGCIDSVKVTVKVQSSCTPSLTSRTISMSTSTNAGSVTATLCGAGTITWVYKDGTVNGKLLKTESGVTSTYTPVYGDFNNEVGDKIVICRAVTGTGVGSCRSVDQEIRVSVSATLEPGVITCSQDLLCSGSKVTIGESKAAGVVGMDLSDISYEWYHNDSEKISGETGSVLRDYMLPANTSNALITHRFHRIAKSASISQTSASSNVIEVKVPGLPAVGSVSVPGAICADGNLALADPFVETAGGIIASRVWKLDGMVLSSPYKVGIGDNGKSLTHTVTMQCGSTITTNGVAVTVNPLPLITGVVGGSRCGTGAVSLSATGSPGASVEWYDSSVGGGTLLTGNLYTTPSLNMTATYYAGARIASTGCASIARSSVTASVTLPAVTSAGTIGITVGTGSACGQVYLNGGAVAAVECGDVIYEWYEGGTRLATGVNGGSLTGVSAGNHTYTRRAIATSNTGSYRDVSQVVTVASCGATDGAGNTYKEVTIGNQTWMAENLRYKSGSYVEVAYGCLYSYSTASTICSNLGSEWRLPSQADWLELINALGGMNVAGGKIKSTSGWRYGCNGTNESGLNAFPIGNWNSGIFYHVGEQCYFWVSGDGYCLCGPNESWPSMYISGGGGGGNAYTHFPVRCMKNK